MQANEKPELEGGLTSDQTRKHWKASPDIEEKALEVLHGILPTRLRASERRLEEFYQRGYLLYQIGRYAEAQPYFNMLVLADPQNPKFLMALGASYHMQKKYASAIQMYSTILYFDPLNPLPLYHAADCYIKIYEPFGALIALEMAIERCRDPKFNTLKDRMKLMVERLGKELKEKMKQSSESFINRSGKKLVLVEGKVIQQQRVAA